LALRAKLTWTAVAVLGAISFGVVALTRGEPVNAAWLIVGSVCITIAAGQSEKTCQQFFRERQDARYAGGKGPVRGCC